MLLLSWFQASARHLEKYCALHTALGADVLVVTIDTLQLLRPKTGYQLIASDVLQFLANNECYERILLHGFSVGGCLWGECLVKIAENFETYGTVVHRIQGQVWDSVAAVSAVPRGTAQAILPKYPIMQKPLKHLLQLYLYVNKDSVHKPFKRSEEYFQSSPVRSPALLFFSKTDLIGTETHSRNIAQTFTMLDIDVTCKCFEDSPHVNHYRSHREEYLKYLMNHLEMCNFVGKKS